MKKSVKSLLLTSVCFGFVSFAMAQTPEGGAEPTTPAPQEKQMPVSEQMPGMARHMKGGMTKDQMHAMMASCQQMHKDGKTCDNEMMTSCQKNMNPSDCQKMMGQAKSQDKTKK